MKPWVSVLSVQRTGALGALAGIAFVAFVALAGLTTVGRDILVLAVVRLGLLVALWGYGQASGVVTGGSRLGRAGWLLAVAGAAFNLLGALGWVVTDGWWFNPFGEDVPNRPEYTFWYAYVVGLSALAFAVGTFLVGLAGWRRHGAWPAVLAVLAGLLYLFAIPLGGPGHLLWIAPWIALGAWLAFTGARARPGQGPGARVA